MYSEPKNLIKQGIIGWIYLAVMIAYLTLTDYESVKSVILSKDLSIIVSLLFILFGSGVVLGNLIYQLSLSLGHIIWIKRNKYFKTVYEMEMKMLISQHGIEIQRIYSSKLEKIEELRALSFSLFLSWITIGIFALTITFSIQIGILMLVLVFLNWIVVNNWVFYQNGLDYFIKKIKAEYD